MSTNSKSIGGRIAANVNRAEAAANLGDKTSAGQTRV
jgi:hypothetical protein